MGLPSHEFDDPNWRSEKQRCWTVLSPSSSSLGSCHQNQGRLRGCLYRILSASIRIGFSWKPTLLERFHVKSKQDPVTGSLHWIVSLKSFRTWGIKRQELSFTSWRRFSQVLATERDKSNCRRAWLRRLQSTDVLSLLDHWPPQRR